MDDHDDDASSTKAPPPPALIEAMTQLAKTVSCPVCMDYMTSPVTLPCSHTYCQECIEEVIKSSTKHNCPLCQKTFTKKNMSAVSKTLEPVISSIKNFIACFEGKPVSGSVASGDDSLHVDKKFRMQRPDFKAGDLVQVAPRLWPGINKPGGVAWVQAVKEEVTAVEHQHTHQHGGQHEEQQKGVYYDCKYVLGGGIDVHVPAAYIRVAGDLNEDRGSRSRRTKPPKAPTSSNNNINNKQHQQQQQKRSSPRHSAGSKRKAASDEEVEGEDAIVVGSPVRILTKSDTSQEINVSNPPLVFLCSTLQTEELLQVHQFCERFPPATVHETYSSAVTHVIVHVDRKGKGKGKHPVRILKNRTMKYLQGVLGHKWIVSCDWLGDCVQKDCLLDETPYEVTRDSKADAASFGPKWSREYLLASSSSSFFSSSSSSSSRPADLWGSGTVTVPGDREGLFDVGCQYIFAGPFCHPGPTIDNLSFLLKTGGGAVLSSMAAVVDLINASLDGGLCVRWKQAPRPEELIVVVVTSEQAANEFCRQVFMSISDIRQECAYDFGDFIDHLNGFVVVILSDWIFDCISNYSVSDPLQPSRFRVDLGRSMSEHLGQQVAGSSSGSSSSSGS